MSSSGIVPVFNERNSWDMWSGKTFELSTSVQMSPLPVRRINPTIYSNRKYHIHYIFGHVVYSLEHTNGASEIMGSYPRNSYKWSTNFKDNSIHPDLCCVKLSTRTHWMIHGSGNSHGPQTKCQNQSGSRILGLIREVSKGEKKLVNC